MFYWLAKAVLGPLVRLVYHPWIKGAENIPSKGAAILASNHLAVFDSVFVPAVVPRRVFYIAKSDYFTGRGLKGRLTAGFMKGVGMIPVDRAGGQAALAALEQGRKVLDKGHLFGIYPEGTRSPDGRLYRGKTGAARLALETGAPVVPIAMIGTNVAQPAGKRLPKLVRVGMMIGQPIDLSKYRQMGSDRFVLREITDQIMFEIMKLSGQEYVDVYAATMKARLASGAPAPGSETADAAPGGRFRPADLEPPVPPEPEDAQEPGPPEELDAPYQPGQSDGREETAATDEQRTGAATGAAKATDQAEQADRTGPAGRLAPDGPADAGDLAEQDRTPAWPRLAAWFQPRTWLRRASGRGPAGPEDPASSK